MWHRDPVLKTSPGDAVRRTWPRLRSQRPSCLLGREGGHDAQLQCPLDRSPP